jgi:hypothetical protein
MRQLALFCLCLGLPLLTTCGGYSNSMCSITANIIPASATADHSLAPPGNQAQFSLQSSVSGNCPLIPDKVGDWSTSDMTSTSIDGNGLATCTGATSTAATISNSGTIRGKPFTSATLTCK